MYAIFDDLINDPETWRSIPNWPDEECFRKSLEEIIGRPEFDVSAMRAHFVQGFVALFGHPPNRRAEDIVNRFVQMANNRLH